MNTIGPVEARARSGEPSAAAIRSERASGEQCGGGKIKSTRRDSACGGEVAVAAIELSRRRPLIDAITFNSDRPSDRPTDKTPRDAASSPCGAVRRINR